MTSLEQGKEYFLARERLAAARNFAAAVEQFKQAAQVSSLATYAQCGIGAALNALGNSRAPRRRCASRLRSSPTSTKPGIC
ncbi:MAG: hypothetical protein JO002_00260 [Burkholderiaceae bacterium]|nr:hypothetical protein [Burkholderiaceae bacterium]